MGFKLLSDATAFDVWAPHARRVDLILLGQQERRLEMSEVGDGRFRVEVDEPLEDVDYLFDLGRNRRRADPASRYQPHGVLGPSRVVRFDSPSSPTAWRGRALDDYVIYEMHIGAFSKSGDFDGAIGQLDALAELGVTAVELMPLAQFPGQRNWGYDGAFPYAVQNSYGGPWGLKRFVEACHVRNMAVVLDVVYNHLGPEGNYLNDFGPYFTDRYRTPWGKALNFDGPHSDRVREFFIENALYWIREFHIDGLRLDAIQMIFDISARPFLSELSIAVHDETERLGRPLYLFGETNQNDPQQIRPPEQGGLGLDCVWNDDFHHSLQALLTGERVSVYEDHGTIENLAKAYREGFVLTGQYSRFLKRRHGRSSQGVDARRLVVFAQNHDQIGNRLYGERLTSLASFEQTKLAAATLLLSPYVPLLFMGDEYGETAPFLYFVDHGDSDLNDRVFRGRLQDHPEWIRDDPPPPRPAAKSTFRRSRLRFDRRNSGSHQLLWGFHKRLLQLRKSLAPLRTLDNRRQQVTCAAADRWMASRRTAAGAETLAIFHFGDRPTEVSVAAASGRWQKVLDSTDTAWGGPGGATPEALDVDSRLELTAAPNSAVVLLRSDLTEGAVGHS